MKNRSHVVTLMAAIAFAFVVIAVVAPAALAGRSEVYFSDVNGTPKTEWSVGEVLYITVISHDENRDSDEVELIDRRSVCRTHTGVDVPCLEIWDPNTKDSETNQGNIVLVETGIDTGIFRSQGIAILPVEADPGYNENGSLEVFAGDTLMVRYQSPSDDNDIDLDQVKVSSTAGQIRITNQAGQEVPLWQIGQQIWVTVEDPDQNVNPLKPDTIKGVALWNPRCVWDVLERAGDPRLDQPEPKPCGAPVGFDDRLNAQFPGKFAPSLTLVETGPSTGLFRNVNGITLTDQLGPVREFRDIATALSFFVNHKDTIVAFYRLPTLVGLAAPLPPPPPPTETRTDDCPASPLFSCSRTVPLSVAPGQTFDVVVTITAKQAMKLIAIREQAPTGFQFGTAQAIPTPKNISTNGALRAAWDGGIAAGQTITLTYQLLTGPTPGTFKIRGFFTSAPFAIVPLVSNIVVSPAAAAGLATAGVSAQAENASLRLTRQAPIQVNVGQPFTVTLSVTAKQALAAVSVKENFDGFTLVDQGADFIGLEGTTLRGLMIQPAAGTLQTFTYQLSCPAEGTFTISGTAESKDVVPVSETSMIICGAGGPPPPPPPTGAVRFDRGAAGPNDPQDFALAQAKVGHMNPAKLQFTDINGNEISEFRIGTEFFITLIDDDQNVDSDHVETLCVQVFNVNGGREGDTPGSSRQFSPLLKNEPGACLEDHVRDLFEWKTGVQLVETGTNTGVFRNPNALKVIPICDRPETSPFEESFDKDPNATQNIQIHKLNWWQNVEARTALKECNASTPFLNEGRAEFTLNPTAAVEDVPGMIAVHAGDTIYVAFQDQLVDPFDVVYATARVQDFQSINQVQFVDENGAPADTYKIGQDVFVKLRDDNRNVNSDVVDKITILMIDRNSGDWENVVLEETGQDTGEFMNRAGLSLQPATSPSAVKVNNNRLEMFDRDTIEAHYQDNFNPKDYSAAWIRLIPQPGPGPVVEPVRRSTTAFTDAAGQPVTDYAVGDTIYVTVTDVSQNASEVAIETIFGALAVTNTRTGEFVIVDASETGPDTGAFLSDPITTGAPGSGTMLEVEENDVLEAIYVDPADPNDTSKDTITIVTKVFACTGAKNFPNPFIVTTTFEALGSGIAQIGVTVYSLAGQQVAQISAAGAQVTWDGRGTETFESLGSGVYLYQVTCTGRDGQSETTEVQKLVIVR